MGEAWFSVLALEYYVHLSEWTWTEATWRNYWIRGLQMCCGRQDQTSIPDWWWSSAPPSSALPFLLRSPILGHFCYYQKAGELKVSPMNVLLLPEGSSFCACLWWPILVWLDIGNSMGSIDSMHNKRHHFFFAMASFLQSCRRRMELGFHSIRTHAFDLVLSQNLTLNQHIFLGLILYTEARIIMDQKLGTRICGRSTKLSLWAMRKVHHHLGR